MAYQLDAIDKQIIQLLLKDGKMKIKEVAHELNMTNTPVFDRIKRLEKEGFIEGYTAIVNTGKLGFTLIAYCSVMLEKHNTEFLETFERDIRQLPEVIECYYIAGMFDFLLKVFVKDMSAYQQFVTQHLASLDNISRVQSSFVLTEIKREYMLPL